MKKIMKILLLLIVFALVFSSTLTAMACWEQPESFEVLSEDGNKVFVFTPDDYGITNAYAAVYEIINNERQLVYTVDDLSSFAYKSNFHFSADMTHFARTFNPSGMPVFEVFSNGVRTRTVMRNDFIEDYASEDGLTSIGPIYTVGWIIEESSPYSDAIAISTDEGSTLYFDLATARFSFEADLPVYTQSEATHITVSQVQPLPVENSDDDALLIETLFVVTPVHDSQTQSSQVGIIIAGFVAMCVVASVLFYIKRSKVK